jgi:hypothetical protein
MPAINEKKIERADPGFFHYTEFITVIPALVAFTFFLSFTENRQHLKKNSTNHL